MTTTPNHVFVAVDPLAILLPGEIYADLTKPRPGPEDLKARVRQAVQGLDAGQREQVAANLRTIQELTRAFEAELGRTVAPGQAEVRAR